MQVVGLGETDLLGESLRDASDFLFAFASLGQTRLRGIRGGILNQILTQHRDAVRLSFGKLFGKLW